MTDNRTFWLQFFELYKNLPELWKLTCKDYKDRKKKAAAYNILAEKCKAIEPDADKEFVARKINSFRSTYRRELKKIKEASDCGNDYEPTLWYFDNLSFLKQQEEDPLEGLSNEIESENESCNEKIVKKSHSDVQDRPHTSSFKKKKNRPSNSDELLELATKRLKRCDDYSQTLANVWASEFRLASEEQKFYAKKAIDDILFEARLGTLHRNSVKINESPMNNEYSIYNSKRESLNCGSPDSATDSITIERVGIDNHENDI